MGILELWNIDTFEGGSKSRTNFLEKQAMKFEKNYNSIFIMVSNKTIEQAQINSENGKKPDLISFGIGIGDDLIQSLIPLSSSYNVRSDLLSGGKCNSIQYAVPYIFGRYVIISDNEYQLVNNLNIENLGFGGNSNNIALLGACKNNIQLSSIYKASESIDSFSAYDKFLDKKFSSLLGTQRDLYRIKNRIDNGNMNSKNFCYLENFTDLVQYIGICSTDSIKQEIAQKYINLLLSKESQESIVSYNMFSVNSDIYSSGEFDDMEKALSKNLKTISIFLSDHTINEIKSLSLRACQNDESAKESLNKYYVLERYEFSRIFS